MIFVYRPAASTSARLLADEVDGVRIKHEENLIRRCRPTDKVIMWGSYLPQIRGRVLNNVPLQNKYEDIIRLRDAGVVTVDAARQQPAPVLQPTPIDPLIAMWESTVDLADTFSNTPLSRSTVAQEAVTEFVRELQALTAAMRIPVPVAPPPQPLGEWLRRLNNHVGGNDLLHPPARADFWVKKDVFTTEYRVHSFLGRSIRAGKKVPREGFSILPGQIPEGLNPAVSSSVFGEPNTAQRCHPWIRSYDGGWMISYDGEAVKQRHRDVAHAAVLALGLSFGAVDIGERADGTLVVLEVNRAPGAEGGTVEGYGRAVRKWVLGEWVEGGGLREANAPA